MSGERIDQLIPAANAVPQTPGTRYLAAELMNKRGFNPLEKMMDLYEQLEDHEEKGGEERETLHADRKMKLLSTLAKFYAPQPKSLDVSVKAENTFTIQTVDYGSYINERKHMIPQTYRPQLLGVEEKTIEAMLDGD